MNWIELFKLALTRRDIITIDKLVQDVPEFRKIEDMRTAYTLIDEVKQTFERKQHIIQQKMNNMHHQKAS
ncbi:MAG TPA: hypothetical protein EYH01_01050 [Campylobacterales bacterium]|nr:hypothetical protein [Campylobacterales bacterium]